jgi:DNA polymerase
MTTLPTGTTTSLAAVRDAARACENCDLYRHATQTVFGAGPAPARLMFVGEQPGDAEDLEGRPFVGPAGQLLDGLLEEVGIPRDDVYVTNAVKHFKWEPRGKRRLHQKPTYREVTACRPWLEAEVRLVKPEVIVCLGATAAQAFMGSSYRVTKSMGKVTATQWAPAWMATYHPSAILRMPDEASRHAARAQLRRDLEQVRALLRRSA